MDSKMAKAHNSMKTSNFTPASGGAIEDEGLRALVASFKRRDDVATLIPPGGIGVELGVAGGDFSERILCRSKIDHLYSIDMWSGDRNHNIHEYKGALRKLFPYKTRNSVLRMRFDEALDLFENESLDFIYVDGYAHTGEENGKTFHDWYPKLRPGGKMAGDDYQSDWPLVVEAVRQFVALKGLELQVMNCREDAGNSKHHTW